MVYVLFFTHSRLFSLYICLLAMHQAFCICPFNAPCIFFVLSAIKSDKCTIDGATDTVRTERERDKNCNEFNNLSADVLFCVRSNACDA